MSRRALLILDGSIHSATDTAFDAVVELLPAVVSYFPIYVPAIYSPNS